ncbi:hypothetical protein DITRI_Ditri14bG0113100 [Diplodiscus trichospermus]
MEATFMAKRALFNIPKFLPQVPPGMLTTRRVTWACFSTAYERAEGSNAAAEGEGSSEISDAHRDAIREGLYDDKYQPFATGEGRPPCSNSSFVEDAAKDGMKKAVDTAANVGDTAKKTLDGAWRAAKDTAQGIKERVSGSDNEEFEEDVAVDEVRKVDQPVDTQEYRSIDELKK